MGPGCVDPMDSRADEGAPVSPQFLYRRGRVGYMVSNVFSDVVIIRRSLVFRWKA